MSHGGARVGAGKKVLPMNEKIAKGTYRPCREKQLPATSKSTPCPPSWLNKRAKQIFRHMVKRLTVLGIATASHTEMVSVLATRIEEVQRLDKYLNEPGVGMTYEKKKVIYEDGKARVIITGIFSRPEVGIRQEAIRHVHTLLVEFGLTPSAMNRIGKPKEKGKTNEFENF